MKTIPHLVQKPWAGKFLSQIYSAPTQDIGEAWLLSQSLKFQVKIIDTEENLSIQVHPDDEWAAKLENSKGKTECWLILNAQPGAGVYLGVKPGVSREQFEESLHSEDGPVSLMNFYPVERGDFITVPAGTVHAIGSGITLLEVQQASGITYRLWDWGRKDRELHIEKALKVSNFDSSFLIMKNVIGRLSGPLMKHPDFECFINESHGQGYFIGLNNFEVTHSSMPTSHPFVFVR